MKGVFWNLALKIIIENIVSLIQLIQLYSYTGKVTVIFQLQLLLPEEVHEELLPAASSVVFWPAWICTNPTGTAGHCLIGASFKVLLTSQLN